MAPVLIQPNLVEMSDFSEGWVPDIEPSSVSPQSLLDVLNLLPDLSGALQTRKGFTRVDWTGSTLPSADDGYQLKFIHQYNYIDSATEYKNFILVFSDGTDDSADNIQIWLYDVNETTASRIDTASRAWNNGTAEHWGATICGVYYGGTRGEMMYSYDGKTMTWTDDAATPNFKILQDDYSDVEYGSGTDDDEYPSDFAFKMNTVVKYKAGESHKSDYYQTTRDIRFDKWTDDDDQEYDVGDKVSRWDEWDNAGDTGRYPRSFRCTARHTAAAADNAPGDGTDWKDYWQKITLDSPLDEDDEVTNDWNYLPVAAKTSIGVFHGERLWLRYDEQDQHSRLMYSAPLKPEKDATVADLVFNPHKWAPSATMTGEGGGWIPFNDGDGDAIRALWSLGNYLLVFKRRRCFVLSGLDETTWTKRPLGDVGCVGPHALCERDGLVYFLSYKGLYVTDGTSVEEVRGTGKVRRYIGNRITAMGDQNYEDGLKIHCQVKSWGDFIFMSMPCVGETEEPEVTLCYEPGKASFWYTDLPILGMNIARVEGEDRLFFSAPSGAEGGPSGGLRGPFLYEYAPETGDYMDVDDDGDEDAQGELDIAWYARTAWMPFGVLREQRRIRRTWAVVRGEQDFTLTPYVDWDETAQTVVTAAGAEYASHIEGNWVKDCHAISFQLAGDEAPAAVLAFAIDTEPRRKRYHVA